MPDTFIELVIERVVQETKDVKTFVFRNDARIIWTAGQYLTFVFQINEHEVRRTYSLSACPDLGESPAITFRRIPNGMISRHLFDHFQPGNKLLSSGTGGFFVLPDSVEKVNRFFFFAAGSGIVPIYSMLKSLLHQDSVQPVTLIYSNRSEAETIFNRELRKLEERNSSRFNIEFLFSTAHDLKSARLNNLQLTSIIQRYGINDDDDSLYYICGPLAYMRMIEFELRTAGVRAEAIRKEHFSTAKPLSNGIPADTNEHTVSIYFNQQLFRLNVRYPVTILAEAKKQGINLPYSCEAGKCGNCAAYCESGKVWMMYNEVLTDEDINKGIVLTCSGFPIDGDVVLRF